MSFVVFGVGARSLEANEMASFVSHWVILNTTAVALASAFDQLGPRLLVQHSDLSRALWVHAFLVPLAGTVVAGLVISRMSGGTGVAGTALYCISVALWNGERALCLARGSFTSMANGAVAALAACCLSLMVLGLSTGQSADRLFIAAAIGNATGAFTMRLHRIPLSRSGSRLSLPRREYTLAGSVAIASASVLLISSGALVLASSWGVVDGRAVAFAGIVNLVRIPFMVMNSTSGPVNVELATRAARGDAAGARMIATKWSGLMLGSSVLVAVGVCLLGSRALRVFIGPDYQFELALALAVVAVEAMLWIAGAGRFLGIAIGKSVIVALHWLCGAGAFLAVSVVERLGPDRLVIAPLVGAATVLLLTGTWVVASGSLAHSAERSGAAEPR